MKYFTKLAMAAKDFSGTHVNSHTDGARGYKAETIALGKEVDLAGIGDKSLRRGEPVGNFPQMKMFRDYAKKHEDVLRADLASGKPFYASKVKYEKATALVYKRHTLAGGGHQWVMSVGRRAEDIRDGRINTPRAFQAVSPQPQGFKIHNEGMAEKFTNAFNEVLATGKEKKIKKVVRYVAKLK